MAYKYKTSFTEDLRYRIVQGGERKTIHEWATEYKKGLPSIRTALSAIRIRMGDILVSTKNEDGTPGVVVPMTESPELCSAFARRTANRLRNAAIYMGSVAGETVAVYPDKKSEMVELISTSIEKLAAYRKITLEYERTKTDWKK